MKWKMPGHDAFFSFSHADNEAHGGFVRQFREMLEKRIAARFRLAYPKLEDVEDKIDFFVDWKGFPASGPLDEEIKKHVEGSEFLFMLVGKGYLQSEYCQKERDWFRTAFNQNDATALSRTFLIFLTSEALVEATEHAIGRLRNRIFWTDTRGDRPNTPMRPYLAKEDTDTLEENPRLADVLDRVADTYIERYRSTITQSVSESALMQEIQKKYSPVRKEFGAEPKTARWTVGVGAVTQSLKAYREQLIKVISENPELSVQAVEWGDLVDHREELRNKLANIDVFIQVFDYSAVRAERDDPPGGHLTIQRQLLPPDTQILWWMPPATENGAGRLENVAEHLEVINKLATEAERGDQGKAAATLTNLLQSLRPQRAFAQIIIECSPIDLDHVKNAFRVVRSIWQNDFGDGLRLRLEAVSFRRLEGDPQTFASLDGIVVVDRSQRTDALLDQLFKIQNRLDQHAPASDTARQIFVLPPQSELATALDWPVVMFRGDGIDLELAQGYDQQLRTFLKQVRERAARSAPADRAS